MRGLLLFAILAPTASAARRLLSEGLSDYEEVRVVRGGLGVMSVDAVAEEAPLGEEEMISIEGSGGVVTLELAREEAMFSRGYKEIVIEDGVMSVKRDKPRGCHYAGPARRVRDDGSVEKGIATASLCGPGTLGAVVRYDAGDLQEVGWDRATRRHISFDPLRDRADDGSFCGVNDQFIIDQEKNFGRKPHRKLEGREGHGDHDEAHEGHDHGDHDEAHEGHDHDAHDDHRDDHHEAHDDREGHDHGHDHGAELLSRQGRKLASATCSGKADKYLSVVLFNDAARYEAWGDAVEDHSAEIFAVVKSIYEDVDTGGLYDGDKFDCVVRPRLVGQVTWRGGNPAKMNYAGKGSSGDGCDKCGSSASNRNFCFDGEVSSYCLLTSFSEYVGEKQAELEAILKVPMDNAMLLTSEDLNQGVIGLAWVGRICAVPSSTKYAWDNFFSSGVNEANFDSITKTATIVAHETGHNWGMNHDTSGTNLMGTTLSVNPQLGTANLQFSSKSRTESARFMANKYGSMTDLCVDTPDDEAWDKPVCGDGIVDPGEDCDPGLFGDDDCCSDDCTLKAGCDCSPWEGCCTSAGKLKAGGATCRASVGDCDVAEKCTGKSGLCPPDLSKANGGACTDDNKGRDSGTCYNKECKSWGDDYCEASSQYSGAGYTSACSSSTCAKGYCGPSGGGCYTNSAPGGDGLPCSGGMCLDGACHRGDHHTYHWYRGESDCETASCRDETGAAAASSKCAGLRQTDLARCSASAPAPAPATPRPTPVPATPRPTPVPATPRPTAADAPVPVPVPVPAPTTTTKAADPCAGELGGAEGCASGCAGFDKKTCKKTAGCAYEKKVCVVEVDDECAGLAKKTCKNTEGCQYKKKTCSKVTCKKLKDKKSCKKAGCKFDKKKGKCK